ncbi:MAG: DUF1127 domain-containing protein [Amaricoccus sp.]|uniref:DUF1127 domain-containing protein n=1 Tax=Amaricoccus sp. TaxID=1872485 RepID=UPI0039E30C41
MTASSTAKFGSGFTVVGERTEGLLGRINRAWQDFRAYHATLAELRALSDRQLADLGLGRAGIRGIAHRSVYGN